MDDGENMGFQHSGEGGILNCPSSGMNTNPFPVKVTGISNSSMSIYKSPNVADHFFGSGWDPIFSLSQSENFGSSSVVSHSEFANSPCPVLMENQGVSSTSHLVQLPSVSSFVELEPKLPCFGSGNFSEMVGSFGIHEYSQIANIGCPNYNTSNKVGGPERISTDGVESQEDNQISEEEILGASPSGKRRKRLACPNSQFNSNKNAEVEQQKDLSGESSDVPNKQDEKKQKTEHDTGANMSGKQAGKQAKDSSNCEEAPKENYIHVRARKGQATNSHSLAERVRREKISERMRLLQELVPGCNKITGKAVMLDEIINYVQSLQQQVEFLSMKLATVNPELNIDIERILSKDIVYPRGGSAAILGYGPGISFSHPFPCGLVHGALPGMHSASPQFSPLPQNVLDNELQSLLQMGFDSNSSVDNMGRNGRLKSEL